MSKIVAHQSLNMLAVGLLIVVLTGCQKSVSIPTPTLFAATATQPSSMCSRLAFVAVSEQGGKHSSRVYLFDHEDKSVTLLGSGGSVIWSPSGSYLAILNVPLDLRRPIGSFSICNLNSLDCSSKWSLEKGDFVLWSFDESYIVAGSSDQYGCECLKVLSGNGADAIFNQHCGCPGGSGTVGHRFLGWQEGNLLIDVRRWPSVGPAVPKGPNGVYLFDPQDATWALVEQSQEHDWSRPRSMETRNWSPFTDESVLSANGALLAQFWDSELVIHDIPLEQSYTVQLPSDVIEILSLVWSPPLP